MSDLNTQIQNVLKTAIDKAILATALVSENNTFPAPDTRPADVIIFEHELRQSGMNDTLALISSKLLGQPITARPAPATKLKLHFPAVLVAVKPATWDLEERGYDYNGIPFNTPVIVMKRETRDGDTKFRWDDQTKNIYGVYNNIFVPATDEQVVEAMTALFAARPANSVQLFSSDVNGDVE